MERIAITGSSGLVGTALRISLASRGYEVVRLVRGGSQQASSSEVCIPWDPTGTSMPVISTEPLEGLDAVIHLAGDNLAAGRWTAEKKQRIVESRTTSTAVLATLLASLVRKPRVLISASAIGIYGGRGEESLTELDDLGTGFLAETAKAWERAADPARAAGIRVVHPRFGVVLSPEGGALKKMLPVFRAGLGGRLGDGQQWVSWISLRDAIAAIEFLIDDQGLRGAANLVSPKPVRNREFTLAMGRALHRPTIFAVPKFVLRMMLGEMADETILASARVLPEVLMAEDFRFADVDISGTLETMLR